MAVIKVQSSMFSTVKTVERALEKMLAGDEIHVSKGTFHESITISQDVMIYGVNRNDTEIKGIIIIPKNVHVTFKNMTIKPQVQLLVEGKATFIDVSFVGNLVTTVIAVNNGRLSLKYCSFENSRDLGLTCLNKSEIEVVECHFKNNGKAHIYAENSTFKIQASIFEKSNHAIWLKEQNEVQSLSNTFKEQSGTQIIVQNASKFNDHSSNICDGLGNGILANTDSIIKLKNTIIKKHKLPQIWIQKNSKIYCENCDIQSGEESAFMIRENSEASLTHCYISNHILANIQVLDESRLHMTESQLLNSSGNGVHVKERSIVNFENCTFSKSRLSQLFISTKSIASAKNCRIEKGQQLGVFVEGDSNCTIVESTIHHHPNTGITICDAELTLVETNINNNAGNGILALHNSTVHIDQSTFRENNMPHIAGKEQMALTVIKSSFDGGKAIYLIDQSHAHITDSSFRNGDGVQIEVTDETKITLDGCQIANGNSNAVKAGSNSTVNIYDCQIMHHRLPQVVINDSSLIFKNSELLNGDKNGFIIENYSEALIQDSFISKHRYPQVWLDKHSTVEMKATQIKDGLESDIYVQNHSNLYADQCIIRNDQFQYNIQAVNHSKIDLTYTVVENKAGHQFYMENNSHISHKMDRDKRE